MCRFQCVRGGRHGRARFAHRSDPALSRVAVRFRRSVIGRDSRTAARLRAPVGSGRPCCGSVPVVSHRTRLRHAARPCLPGVLRRPVVEGSAVLVRLVLAGECSTWNISRPVARHRDPGASAAGDCPGCLPGASSGATTSGSKDEACRCRRRDRSGWCAGFQCIREVDMDSLGSRIWRIWSATCCGSVLVVSHRPRLRHGTRPCSPGVPRSSGPGGGGPVPVRLALAGECSTWNSSCPMARHRDPSASAAGDCPGCLPGASSGAATSGSKGEACRCRRRDRSISPVRLMRRLQSSGRSTWTRPVRAPVGSGSATCCGSVPAVSHRPRLRHATRPCLPGVPRSGGPGGGGPVSVRLAMACECSTWNISCPVARHRNTGCFGSRRLP